ncbi:MAG: 2OG-Fe(II) oxygenase [Polyangiales bacterium]
MPDTPYPDPTSVAPDESARITARLAGYDWRALAQSLDEVGHAVLPALLGPDECKQLIAGYDEEPRFRKRVVMGRHGYGMGEYQYFSQPLPPLVQALREVGYTHLIDIANRWAERLRSERRFPETLSALGEACLAVGQHKPTPLLLKYGPGDYNRLHQDLYGEIVFPLQLAVLLNRPDVDFQGGEFVLTEQRPRMQSRVEVVPLARGDAVLFPVALRPVAGVRGDHRVQMRHGVSRIRGGARFTLGVIFHDAS